MKKKTLMFIMVLVVGVVIFGGSLPGDDINEIVSNSSYCLNMV